MTKNIEKKEPGFEEKYGRILMSWHFKEFEEQPRSRSWFIGFGVIFGFLLIYALITLNFLFVVIIVISALLIFLQTVQKPRDMVFTIVEDGLFVNDKFYPFSDISEFWLVYNPPEVKKLYFDFKNIFSPKLVVPINQQNPVAIRKILLNYLEENLDQDQEGAGEIITRRLKM